MSMKFEIGDKVVFSYHVGQENGEIIGVYPGMAHQYHVRLESGRQVAARESELERISS